MYEYLNLSLSLSLFLSFSKHIHMGWLRLVGSFKMKVYFAKYRLFYRALLQKTPILSRSLLIVATPYLLREPLYTATVSRLLKIIGLFCKRAL